jgi:hypothetical protein
MKRFNITLSELEAAVQYAKEHGETEHKTITIQCADCDGIGGIITVSPKWDDERVNITDYSAW